MALSVSVKALRDTTLGCLMPSKPRAALTSTSTEDTLQSTASRLVTAAFEAFTDKGFDAATVDDIAAIAGVSRRTFFRHFRSKEDVIFPDHGRLLAQVKDYLDEHTQDPPLDALCAGVRIVFADYVHNGEISIRRYALTRSVHALRERELSIVNAYQQLFVNYLLQQLPGQDPLALEIAAAAVVTAHNSTLRRWLRSKGRGDASALLDTAFDVLRETVILPEPKSPTQRKENPETAVVVFTAETPMSDVAAAVERHLRRAGRGRTR